MAIKINNTTVIDDSQNLTNIDVVTANTIFGDGSQLTGVTPDRILKPAVQQPGANTTTDSVTPTIQGTDFVSTVGSRHVCTCFQVSECSDFSDCNVFTCEVAGANTCLDVPESCLSFETQYFAKLRYEDNDGCCSEFSDTRCFTTPVDPLSEFGLAACGGFYMGTICAASTCYYLIMAPNATGCAFCGWKTTATDSGVGNDQVDGYGNTYDHLDNASHPAGNWTATRDIGGFTDWYLPARNEAAELRTNKACAPAGEGFCVTVGQDAYWSSTEDGATFACVIQFSNVGSITNCNKRCGNHVRAVRRFPFPT